MNARAMLVSAILILTALSAGVAMAADTGPGAAQHGITPAHFVGESLEGNLQAAIDHALLQADEFYASQGADIRYSYRVAHTTGERGGFAYVNTIRVVILTNAQ